MFGVDKRSEATGLLRVGDDVQHERRLAGRFRAENFNDPAAGHAADPQRQVERQRAGGNHVDLDLRAGVAQAHDAAFAVGFGDGGNGGVQFAMAGGRSFGGFGGFGVGGRFFNDLGRHKGLLKSRFS